MKFAVFLRTIALPFLLITSMLWPRLITAIGILLLLILRAVFINKNNYLTNLTITDDIIKLRFITPLLRSKILNVPVDESKELRLSMDGFRYSALGVLKLKTGKSTHKFIVIKSKVLEETKQQITTADSGFKKAGSDFYLLALKQEAAV